jgi:hypothetical protein
MGVILTGTPALSVVATRRGSLRRESAVLHWGQHRLEKAPPGVILAP